MKRRLKILLVTPIIGLGMLSLGVGVFLQQPQFGNLPRGERLQRIEASPHYANGQFQNLVPTPQLTQEGNFVSSLWKFLFTKPEGLTPPGSIPVIKNDLKSLDKNQDVVIWLGHSSYFLQLGGRRILIDPVFSAYAAPVSFANKAFALSSQYTAEDMPDIDYLLISHDHWDHLDYPTVMALKPKIGQVVCGLGVGGYFEQWGFEPQRIQEADWFEEVRFANDFTVQVLPTRHFSGRLLKRNKTLWASFALITPQRRVFFSGDGGYGPHFKEIGERLQGVDLAIMENGQYDVGWRFIHMMPEEVAQAAEDLGAKALLPGHAGKFAIANHRWDEPFQRITAASGDRSYRLVTPRIGERLELENERQRFTQWWGDKQVVAAEGQ